MPMKNISRIAGLAAVTATSAAAQVVEVPELYEQSFHGHDMMWGDSQWGGFGMFLGPVFMILLIVGIVVATIFILHLPNGGTALQPNTNALAILNERFAKGEIDAEEFNARKKALLD